MTRVHFVGDGERDRSATAFHEFLARAADIVRPKVLGSRPNGFRAFARDVNDEIGPLLRRA